MNILKLTPSCKDYLWGGSRLRSDFGIRSNLETRWRKHGCFPATRTGPAICPTAQRWRTIEHLGNADAVPWPPKRCLSRQAGIVRCCLRQYFGVKFVQVAERACCL